MKIQKKVTLQLCFVNRKKCGENVAKEFQFRALAHLKKLCYSIFYCVCINKLNSKRIFRFFLKLFLRGIVFPVPFVLPAESLSDFTR